MKVTEFGQLCSKVQREMSAVNRFFDDPMTAYSGCGDELAPIVLEGARARLTAILDEAGIAPHEFDEELERRTSPKFAYGFGSVHSFLNL